MTEIRAEHSPHADYLRSVRRLRGRYADRPAELHRRLIVLSRTRSGPPAPSDNPPSRSVRSRVIHTQGLSTPPVTPLRADAQAEFAELVAGRIEAGILRYSSRVELLAAARRMGLGRFEANLAIATVQHRMKRQHEEHFPKPSHDDRYLLVGFAIAVQAVIVAVITRLITF